MAYRVAPLAADRLADEGRLCSFGLVSGPLAGIEGKPLGQGALFGGLTGGAIGGLGPLVGSAIGSATGLGTGVATTLGDVAVGAGAGALAGPITGQSPLSGAI